LRVSLVQPQQQHGLETRSRRLNLVLTDELMRSPISAVRIADGRFRDARASIFTVSAVAEVSIGCPGPKVPSSQRSYEWNDKGGRRFVGASCGYFDVHW
jgi:hypothetical protein